MEVSPTSNKITQALHCQLAPELLKLDQKQRPKAKQQKSWGCGPGRRRRLLPRMLPSTPPETICPPTSVVGHHLWVEQEGSRGGDSTEWVFLLPPHLGPQGGSCLLHHHGRGPPGMAGPQETHCSTASMRASLGKPEGAIRIQCRDV